MSLPILPRAGLLPSLLSAGTRLASWLRHAPTPPMLPGDLPGADSWTPAAVVIVALALLAGLVAMARHQRTD